MFSSLTYGAKLKRIRHKMKEALIYSIAGVAGISILGYSVHMIIGGLVDPQTEQAIIIGLCLLGTGVIGFMAWDVVRRRKRTLNK